MTETEAGQEMARFQTCKILARLALMIVVRFWKLCTSAALILLLIYWMNGGVLTLVFLVFALIGIFYNAQDMFLYYPDQPPGSRLYVMLPDKMGLPYENIFMKTADGTRINAILLKQTVIGAPTLIYLHGNAGNIGHRLMCAYPLYMTCHCNILLVEYRGYGRSDGSPFESGLYMDAEAALDFLLRRKDIDSNRIILLGCSLGGAVAIKLASNQRYASHIAAVILENTFTSLPEIARDIFSIGIIGYVPTLLYKNQYPSKDRIGEVTQPTLFISGLNDELIPPRMMTTLHDLSGCRLKRLVKFEGGTHNETSLCPGYYETISQFVREVIALQPASHREESSVQMEQSDI